jgi:hypothetical protein
MQNKKFSKKIFFQNLARIMKFTKAKVRVIGLILKDKKLMNKNR